MRDTGQKRLSAHEVASYGVMTALALVLGYLEVLFPLPVAIPGVKLGLGNIIVVYALISYGPKPAFLLMLFKVVTSALLFGNPAVFPFSLAGGVLSFAIMTIAVRVRFLSVLGVSILGGVAHNMGQALMVTILLGPAVAVANLPILLIAGILTGLVTGLVCRLAFDALGTNPPSTTKG